MAQLEAFPLQIIEYRPFRTNATAHAIGRCRAEDNNCYIVKANSVVDSDVCATEWIGNSIADSLKLPVAQTKVLRMNDGQLVIGSREIEPRLSDIEVGHFLTGKSKNDLYVSALQETLSSTYALDLALGNIDRHESNFVIAVDGREEGVQRHGSICVIDFGSSDILSSDRKPVPFPRESNTRRAGRLMRATHGFAQVSANETLSRLSKGRDFILQRAMLGLPQEWLPESKRDDLRGWMLGSSFAARLERIDSGLKDGSYL